VNLVYDTKLGHRCRAMLSISSVYAVMQCLSVRLSATFVHSVEMNKHIFKKIIVLPYQTSWEYSDEDRLMGASNAGEVGTDRDSGRIAGYRSMTAAVRNQQFNGFPCSSSV